SLPGTGAHTLLASLPTYAQAIGPQMPTTLYARTSADLFVYNGPTAPPVPAFTFSPSNPVTGSPVSFDGSSSTCAASPCSYRWTDAADRSVLGMGVGMSFTFRNPGTKYVRLTITDGASQSASDEHDVIVAPSNNPLVAAFTYSPSNPVTGSPVSFDASSSTCSASPCSYGWTDDADGSPLGTSVRMSFTFRDAGTKYVRLTITDAQSR